jgi:hypothetical protein
MKKLAAVFILAALALTGCAGLTRQGGSDPLGNLLNPAGGVPVFEHADLVATHAILQQGIANGAGRHVQHADLCVVSWLAHPELQAGGAMAPAAPATPPLPPTAGVISGAAAALVQADAAARGLQNAVTLVETGLPDDIVTGCALFVHDLTPIGVLQRFNQFLRPIPAATGAR